MSGLKSENDPTFRNYNPDAAAKYAALRPGYTDKLIKTIIEAHESRGGQFGILLDVGCGPGTATHSLAPFFQHAFGADHGASMIEAARENAPRTASGEAAQFFVCGAEDLTSIDGLEPGTVDMITAATAAHWFHMPGFYASAAKLLKPNGTLAIWCGTSLYCDPNTTPNAAKVQEVFFELERGVLEPYELPGNKLCNQFYETLPLPWTIEIEDSSVQGALDSFDKSKFQRIEFNKNGHVEVGEKFVQGSTTTLDKLGQSLGTASAVTRWHEDHKKQLEDGEIEHCAARMVRRAKAAMNEVPEGGNRDWIDIGSALALLLIKKNN